MTEPLLSLIAGILVIAAAVYFFRPKGFYEKWMRSSKDTLRINTENALKHIYDCEYSGASCSLNSIAGSLSLDRDASAELLAELEAQDLITSGNESIKLTEEGRGYALHIIRVHRLWEQYLADQTGHSPDEWHQEAEIREHTISRAEADDLAARIGNPIFDPHGDPIPDARGEMPELKGIPLSQAGAGTFARITHIEDEPEAVFAQLSAIGLHPGMIIQVLSAKKEKIVFSADGEESVLAPLFAANVTVQPLEKKEAVVESFRTLDTLRMGETAVVTRISPACIGQQRRRLMDFGVLPGSRITMEMNSPHGDPIAYNIRGALVALRKDQASKIFVGEPVKEESLEDA